MPFLCEKNLRSRRLHLSRVMQTCLHELNRNAVFGFNDIIVI
jgi:hypothetical protein